MSENKNVKFLIYCLLVLTIALFFVILYVYADEIVPSGVTISNVNLDGTHVVTEGTSFSFQIHNANPFIVRIRVSVRNYTADTIWERNVWSIISEVYVRGGNKTSIDIIAPLINSTKEEIIFKFNFYAGEDGSAINTNVDYVVMVVNSDFISEYDKLVNQFSLYKGLLVILVVLDGVVLFSLFIYKVYDVIGGKRRR